jgi:hypothetical protein
MDKNQVPHRPGCISGGLAYTPERPPVRHPRAGGCRCNNRSCTDRFWICWAYDRLRTRSEVPV